MNMRRIVIISLLVVFAPILVPVAFIAAFVILGAWARQAMKHNWY